MSTMSIVLCYLFLCQLSTESFAAPIELDALYDTPNSKEDIKQLLAGYDIDTLRDILGQAGLYDESPHYEYHIKVASEESGTYSAHDEARDGDVAVGEYSYIDPTGALVKVNYTADNDGYHVDRYVQQGFVDLPTNVQKPVVITQRPIPRPTLRPTARPTTARPLPVTTQEPSNDFDLVGRIIKQLTPHIQTSVQSSLGGPSTVNNEFVQAKPIVPVVAYNRSPARATEAPYRVSRRPSVNSNPVQKTIPNIIPVRVKPLRKVSEPKETFDLVGKIIGQLTPYIKDSVSSSLDVDKDANVPRLRTIVPKTSSSTYNYQDLQPKNPEYTYQANKDGSKNIFQAPSSQGFQPRNSLEKVYNIENTKLGADEKLADAILARLAPTVETNVKNILGNNYGSLGDNTPKAKAVYTAGQSTNPLKTYSIGINKPTENNEKIIDTVIKQLSPQIEDSVSSIFNVAEDINHPDLGNIIRRTQDHSDNLKGSVPANKFSFANVGADEKIADEILAKLAPSVETNVKNLLGKNYGALGGNTAKAKSISTAGQSTNPLKTYSFGINKPTENNEKIIDTVIKQLSPQIEDSVSSIFNVAGDINHPDLGKVIRRTQDQSDNLKAPNPVYKYSFANPGTDEKLADEILAKLAPSVETNVKNLLGNNYGTFGGDTPKTKSIYTYGQSTNPFQTYSFGTNNFAGQSTNPSTTYSSGINKPTKNNEKIIDTVIKQLSPQIEDSVSSIFNVAEDINHPDLGWIIQKKKEGSGYSKGSTPVNRFSQTKLDADEKLADEILARLAPSVETNVKNLLGTNYGTLDGNTPKVTSIYKSGQSTSTSPLYLIGINKPPENNEEIIDTVIKNLSPQIKDSVSSIFNVAEDINHPDLGRIVQDHEHHKDARKGSKQVYNGLGLSKSSGDNIADSILAKLTPSIESDVVKSLGQNYGKRTSNSRNTNKLSPKLGDEELADKILGNLTPFIQGSVGRYFSNQNGNTAYTSTDDDNFTDGLIDELLPTIQTMIGSKLGGYQNERKPYTPFFKE